MCIDKERLKKILGKLQPWKAPGHDGVQGFWYKRFTSLHERLVIHLSDILNSGSPLAWMTLRRTVLVPKDVTKGSTPSNFHPITRLPTAWKILTAMVSYSLYKFLDNNHILPWEQKGCMRGSRGTKDHSLIDKNVMKASIERRTNLILGRIDYRKAYDMVPHSWIKETLSTLKASSSITKLICNSMAKWTTNLESNGKHLGTVSINRRIFQGDSLSPLLFVMAVIPWTVLLQ